MYMFKLTIYKYISLTRVFLAMSLLSTYLLLDIIKKRKKKTKNKTETETEKLKRAKKLSLSCICLCIHTVMSKCASDG